MKVLENIIDVIESRLAIMDVVRPDRRGEKNSPKHGRVTIVQKSVVKNARHSCPGNPPAVAYDATLHLVCFARVQEDSSSTSISTACNAIVSQVIKLITNPTEDPVMWYRMNGNAIETAIGTNFPFTADAGDNSGVILPVVVTFRVSENNPDEVRP